MADFDNRVSPFGAARAGTGVIDQGLRAHMLQVYNYMALGLLITGAASIGMFKLAFVEDPWGTRLEIVQDSAKLGLHHVHLRAPNPDTALAWYASTFGGTIGKLKDRIDGINYGGVWLLAQKGEAVPSAGHAIDHIGFRPLNVDNVVAALKTTFPFGPG